MMKNSFKRFGLTVMLTLCFSCEKYLDVSPDFGVEEDDVFSSYETTRGYLDNSFNLLLDWHSWDSQNMQRNNINALSDEGGALVANNITNTLNPGSWTNKDQIGELGWNRRGNNDNRSAVVANAFLGIRIANRILARIDDIPNMSESQRNELLGQSYFFRAWFYFEIIRRMGGMPKLDHVFTADEELNLKRLNYSESTEFLLEDLNQAIDLLPGAWPDSEVGRPNKVAAMAVKEMATLYAASPLMQNDINSTQQMPYSQEWSERAAASANDVLQYIQAGAGGSRARLMDGDEYENIFYTDGVQVSDESLWYNYDGGRRPAARSLRCMYIPRRFSNGNGVDAAAFSNPTQNIVEKFEVINNGVAYPIYDPRSGYDPQHPFYNENGDPIRDPRLYSDVILPGERWHVDQNGNPAYMELYVGGTDYDITNSANQTRDRELSGYVCKKYIWPETSRLGGQNGQFGLYNLNTIYIRVSQVYLDYAEAMNEAYGPNADPNGYGLNAVDAINVLRNRVGMPDVPTDFTASKEIFRDRIRNERAVELFWENQRWFDIRRWMIAEDVLAKPIRGIRAFPPSNHEEIADKSTLEFTYQEEVLESEQRVFQNRHYWYPVAQSDAKNLTNFKQNPGW